MAVIGSRIRGCIPHMLQFLTLFDMYLLLVFSGLQTSQLNLWMCFQKAFLAETLPHTGRE